MKVTQNPLPNTALENTKPTGRASSTPVAEPSKGKPPVSSGDSGVAISDQAILMKQARDAVYASPDSRADKVSDLKRKVKDGSYKVDSQAVADKLVDEHLSSNFGKNNL